MLTDSDNPQFRLAVQYVTQTASPVFLTGRAGTGKTTFLKWLRENCFKKMAVVAPTGVAAINAGGTTLHSFFQLPFGPFLPVSGSAGWGVMDQRYSTPNSLFKNIRFSAARKELLQELELLVIDEVSMVRSDTLDAVDTILRHFRQQPFLPYGGIQVLYIGDLFQLPPVVSNEEKEILGSSYDSEFFFDAKVVRQSPPVYLELKKIYRQKEGHFIGLLNKIRSNRIGAEDMEQLHDHYEPEFIPPRGQNYITLTSHNAKADTINQQELDKLRGPGRSFEATVTGEFNEKAYPAEKTLTLKVGAQVMLIKNDKGETRRYYNGKIGIVGNIADDCLTLLFPGEPNELVLEKEIWNNIRYNYDREKDAIEEEELGTFRQYPIRLAWAITIHKSQGLTFDKAVIDAGASFAPGQVYVALSRLTAREGLVLRSRITHAAIRTDARVVAWTEAQRKEDAADRELREERLSFIGESLRKTFDWSRFVDRMREHYAACADRRMPEKEKTMLLARQCLDKAFAQQETAVKFSRQLEQLLPEAENDGYRNLLQRTEAAVTYFMGEIEIGLVAPLEQHIAGLKGKQRAKKHLQEIQTMKTLCCRKKQQVKDALQLVRGLNKGMDAGELLTGLQEERKSRETPPERTVTSAVKPQKGETNRATLHLYRQGIPISEIAIRRGLTQSTIEGHLASFVTTGEVEVKELVAEQKIGPILAAIKTIGGSSLGPIRSRLGNSYTFGEIRAVMNHLKYSAGPNNGG